MKMLTAVRLINWHRFENETIEFSKSVLLSGENGAGKSTILDAIQYVMTCSTASFNKAAHDKGKRTLGSYVRCKTGREDRPYERKGSLSAHIALSFYDEERRQPFIAGAVMDSASEENEPVTRWYIAENMQLNDDLFLNGRQVKSISQFLATNKGRISYENTQRGARKMMLGRFGRLDEKFLTLVPKALAFRPINDIKEFVYTYVLDEKKVNIDALRENVRSFQDLERMLQDVRQRIEELEEIRRFKAEADNYVRIDKRHEYYLARVEQDLLAVEYNKARSVKRKAEAAIKHLEKESVKLDRLLEGKEESIYQLRLEMQNDEQFQAFQELDKRKRTLEEALENDKTDVSELIASASAAADMAEALLGELKKAVPEADEGDTEEIVSMIGDYVRMLRGLESLADLTIVHVGLQEIEEYKRKKYDVVNRRLAECDYVLRSLEEQQKELNEKIRMLESRKLVYRPEVVTLQNEIRNQLRRAGRSGDVRILCELLEISKPAWRNAVEGYLNTQRFCLLTEPEDFDLALSVYDKLRSQKRLYGVGLINTAKLGEYDDAPEDSLAECVTSKNVWAKRYINMVLGKVHCADSLQELKKYPVAITRQCMRYQNHVASAISPAIYEKPYIGASAYTVQLEQAMYEKRRLEIRLNKMKEESDHLSRMIDCLDRTYDSEVRHGLRNLESMRSHKIELDSCISELKELAASRTLVQKQQRLERLEAERSGIKSSQLEVAVSIGEAKERISSSERKMEDASQRRIRQDEMVSIAYSSLGDEASDCEKEYIKQTAAREYEKYRQNYESARKGNRTRREKAESLMSEAMRRYRTAHDFGAADSIEGYSEYDAEYDKLKNSQLLEYEGKVQRARELAEAEFREQFLAKLQENIKQAQAEFRNLNKALSGIRFSNERYEFRYEARKSLKKFYDMIMDDFNILGGESLFSSAFNDAHREAIDELFERLALDDDNSTGTLEEYTDYRTFMDYDIRISFDDGSYMYYSKVSREKSGGETQTPFYITIAASFMQLYRSGIGSDSIGLVMMDEAFNNMDDTRMSGVLSFMNNSDLQTIIAAPPEKIQYIAPDVESVLLVLTDGELSYVEEFEKRNYEEI